MYFLYADTPALFFSAHELAAAAWLAERDVGETAWARTVEAVHNAIVEAGATDPSTKAWIASNVFHNIHSSCRRNYAGWRPTSTFRSCKSVIMRCVRNDIPFQVNGKPMPKSALEGVLRRKSEPGLPVPRELLDDVYKAIDKFWERTRTAPNGMNIRREAIKEASAYVQRIANQVGGSSEDGSK